MSEKTEIDKLLKDLETKDFTNDKLFQRLICESEKIFGVSEDRFCSLFFISKPGVRSWKLGNSSPHPLMRRHIYQLLREEGLREDL